MLEEGCYEINDINNTIVKESFYFNTKKKTQLSFNVWVDPIDFRSYIKCNGTLVFNILNSIEPVLGFEKRDYKPEYEMVDQKKLLN